MMVKFPQSGQLLRNGLPFMFTKLPVYVFSYRSFTLGTAVGAPLSGAGGP